MGPDVPAESHQMRGAAMGVLYDYFRASDPAAAATVMELPAGPLVPGNEGQPPFDGVDAKGIDPTVILGQLVAIARGVPWSTDTVTTRSVWPPPDTAPANAERATQVPEDSPWATGPWVEELDDRTRDTLADIDDSRLAEVATRWAQIAEFTHYSDIHDDSLSPLLANLVGLARRARDAGHRLYCWSSL
jgi:hypothetical protein